MKAHTTKLIAALALAAALLAGCTATPPSHFYMLAAQPSERTFPRERPLSVGVGPVDIAAYLDQAQIVTQAGEYEYTMHEFNRWTAPLRNTVPAVLREDLAVRLPHTQVFGYPWMTELGQPDYQVGVDLLTFHCSAVAAQCRLRAFWTIGDLRRSRSIARKETVEAAPGGADFASQTAALSGLLGKLADEIAGALPVR